MRRVQQATLPAFLAVTIGTAAAAGLAGRSGLIQPAQAQTEDEKKGKGREKQKAAPPAHRPPPPSPPPRKVQPPPPRATAPPPPREPLHKHLPAPEKPAKRLREAPPPAAKLPAPEPKKEGVRRLPPPPVQQGILPPSPKERPPGFHKAPIVKPPGPLGPATVRPAPQPGPLGPLGPQGPAPKRFDDVRKGRLERVEDGGRLTVIQEPGNRVIIKQDNRIVIRHDEAERFRRRPGAKSERRPDGNVETFYVRPDGVRIVTVVDGHGRLLRRYRRTRDGRERNIIDNRRHYRRVGVGVGIGVLGIVALNLPPPRVTIPLERYIVEYDDASDDDLYEALDAPPIEDLDRAYSLEEVLDNYELRARVRSIDLHTINFESGSWEVTPDQYHKLERVARAMLRVLRRNAEAVFMIAGYTDAVGSDEDNASLSDRRATAVAEVLSDTFDVPPENLVTRGYGEQYLRIDTQGPEPRNRRVSIANITGLMAER